MRSFVVPWVSYCELGHIEVLLDARHNRYSSVPAGTFSEALSALDRGDQARSAAAQTLLDRGYVDIGGDEPPAGGLCKHSSAKLTAAASAASPRRDLGSTLVALSLITWATCQLRMMTFELLLRGASAKRAPTEPIDFSTISRSISAFRRARYLTPGRDSCLRDSLALRMMLARMSVPSTLVLGVSLDPFAAHCWLECGKWVVGDSTERVAQFTPIWVSK